MITGMPLSHRQNTVSQSSSYQKQLLDSMAVWRGSGGTFSHVAVVPDTRRASDTMVTKQSVGSTELPLVHSVCLLLCLSL